MQKEVLRVLRTEARSWWRHRQLRRTGRLDEARRLERQTIRRDLGYLRTALNNPNAYVICGGGGNILHPVRNIIAFANLPKVTMGGAIDPEPWTSSSRVSLLTYLDAAERLGARIVNDPRVDRAT